MAADQASETATGGTSGTKMASATGIDGARGDVGTAGGVSFLSLAVHS